MYTTGCSKQCGFVTDMSFEVVPKGFDFTN